TAAAVLAYKRKRNIVNRTYQAQADNIVGKMTMAALDREMVAFDDDRGRTRCKFGGVHEPRRFTSSPALPARAARPASPAQPRDQSLARRNDALHWVNSALRFLRQVHGIALFQRMNNSDQLKMDLSRIETTEPVKALKVHFKFQDAPDSLQFL